MLVPLFQRPYEWNDRERGASSDDLLINQKRDDEVFVSHFTGAMFRSRTSVPVGV